MVLGIATGTAVGIVGGLFHMFNNALYKSCLFLAAGAAERRAGTGELDAMGGLARSMPVTFGAALVAALAISGVPPLNGFVSKWMVYQGIIQMGQGGWLWIIALVAAMFGSALTLASFVKVLHSVFLGQPHPGQQTQGPTPNALMGLPMVVLAATCVLFGVAAYAVPVSGLLLPALPQVQADFAVRFVNPAWQPGIATLLLCAALVVGLLIYLMGSVSIREDEAYIGGEAGERAQAYRFSGVEFYGTVAELPPLRMLYNHAAHGWYDVYHLGRRAVSYAGGILRAFHSGVLLTYVAWFVLGMAVLMWVFLGKWFAHAVSP
jgi:NADH:ubiquinone oxidoreductase subunit 5 (subunit L)/multisubunit Na+/H+ antiporter MnhA subunit